MSPSPPELPAKERALPDRAGSNERALVLGLLLLVSLAGAALRFHGLDAQSMWNDELSSWTQSRKATLGEVIEKGVRPTTYPPAYQVLLYYVERWIGESETALRLPSAVVGVAAILAIHALGAQLYSRREGLVAATLLAFSYQPLYYSQEARAYSFLLLGSILSSLFWFRVLRRLEAGETPSGGDRAGYVASAIATIYLHYFGLLLVAVQLAGLVALSATRRRALAHAVLLASLVAASYLPWLPYLLEDFGLDEIHLEEPGLHTLFGYWRFLFYDASGTLQGFVALVFAAALARAFAARDPGRRGWASRSSTTVLLAAWWVAPFAVAFVRSKLALPMMTDRNLLVSLPAAFLLLSRALTFTLPHRRLQAVTVGAMVALLLHGLFVTGAYYTRPRKEQFREAAALVAKLERELPNARVVAHGWSPRYFDYYLVRTGAAARVDLAAGLESDVPRLRRFLAEERPDYVWMLAGHRLPERAFMQELDGSLELVFHQPLVGAFARLYRRPRAGRPRWAPARARRRRRSEASRGSTSASS
jgi:4-amino-4-deoxy-L-arabinose transferase-like glycosyltransferase